ncbi:hypothetical protein AOLI_G00090740 [Acnodon oligacanthus]
MSLRGFWTICRATWGLWSTTLARRKIAAVSVKATEPDSRTEATDPAGQTEDPEEGGSSTETPHQLTSSPAVPAHFA